MMCGSVSDNKAGQKHIRADTVVVFAEVQSIDHSQGNQWICHVDNRALLL